MAIELKMPALSPTMEEGTLAKWLVKEGDTVSAGDVLAEIETDKATMEFESIDEGTVNKILVPEGAENVKVGTVIAVLAGEGEGALVHRVQEAPPLPGRLEVEDAPPAAARPAPLPAPEVPGAPDSPSSPSSHGRRHTSRCSSQTNPL